MKRQNVGEGAVRVLHPGPRELWLGFGGANGAHHGAEAHHELLTETSTP